MTNNRFSSFDTLVKKAKLDSKTFTVTDPYRTNPLSHAPGGSKVKIVYADGSARIYDKIKNVDAYIRYIKKRSTDKDIVDIIILSDDAIDFEFYLN